MTEPAFRRILLKLSGEALMGDLHYGADAERIAAIARQVKFVADRGVEIAIVVGGGNIYRGMQGAAAGMDRATGDYMGMLATVLNALALQDALERAGAVTRVLSALHIREVAEPYIQRRLGVMDSTALSLCMDNNLPIHVFNMDDERNIDRIVCGERVGTVVRSGGPTTV